MATNLPSYFSIQFLEHLLEFVVNFTLFKYVKSRRNYGFLITKELIFGFQILDLKDHFSASLNLIVGSTEAASKVFLLLFLFSDCLKSNPTWFSDIFWRHICSAVTETIGVTNYATSSGAKKCSENQV